MQRTAIDPEVLEQCLIGLLDQRWHEEEQWGEREVAGLVEGFRGKLRERACAAGWPARTVLGIRLEGEASWRAFCTSPAVEGYQLTLAAIALRGGSKCFEHPCATPDPKRVE